MKSMTAAIFFVTNFYRAGGGHGPLAPPPPLDSLLPVGVKVIVSPGPIQIKVEEMVFPKIENPDRVQNGVTGSSGFEEPLD